VVKMSLQILHKGLQLSIPQDQTGFTGNLQTDLALAVVTKMVAGKIVGINSNSSNGAVGYAGLADGLNPTNSVCLPVGVLINDAAGYFFENPPAYASGMLAVLKGPAMIITDQWLAGQTFVAGTPVYAGASGLFTATPTSTPYGEGTAGQPIGIAMNAPAAGGNLQVALNGSF
jgi:hypothetical protein